MSDTINETVDRILNSINEERGIARDVFSATNEILEYVKKKYPSVASGNFKIMIYNKRVDVTWVVYNNSDRGKSQTIFNPDGSIRVNYVFRAHDGVLDTAAAMESIQHELEHLWEKLHYGKPYKDQNLYQYGRELMNSDFVFDNIIGDILYLSRNWEQRAYYNGLYGYLINSRNNGKSELENMKETQIFKGLTTLIDDVKLLKQAMNTYQDKPMAVVTVNKLHERFKLTLNDIVNIGEETIRRITREIYRTVHKAMEDNKENKSTGIEIHERVNFDNRDYISKRYGKTKIL